MIPKPEKDSNEKLTGKFYPLQNAEWVKACKNLTHTQLSVLYYLRSADPYSNGMRVKASKIADELQISRQAVYKAIDVLEEKKYIEKEDVEYSLKLRSRGCLCDSLENRLQLSTDGDSCKPTATDVNVGRQLSTDGDSCKRRATVVNAGRQTESETLAQQESQDSKINKTYKDFTDSLSEGEREDFLKFGETAAKDLPKPPRLIKKWIAKNWEDLAEQWFKSKGQASPVQTSKWENDPRTRDWLAIIEETANPLEFAAGDREKLDFIKWAKQTKQFSWLREEES
ncbi:MarR family transcriptional regulator [Nostoc sp. CENA67]|uniref:MarR family transcriptional regulator n=1 Tax=Amazonocrinis nigriterrae CENA67 TaxID=2794033 RepID=A0A8J7HR36_9NOST|nr:helix-turn-helix domain-containing protein [Amazonocrinis nigriterrae]MBH8564448.1 MarR family transcriptional regulator [Amazonocrinis nigriterrae CENA67]